MHMSFASLLENHMHAPHWSEQKKSRYGNPYRENLCDITKNTRACRTEQKIDDQFGNKITQH